MRHWVSILFLGCLALIGNVHAQTTQNQNLPKIDFCQFDQESMQRKTALLLASIKNEKSNPTAEIEYKALLAEHAEQLRKCRATAWPAVQAIWIRFYPCDLKPGNLDQILDNIVNFGYNRIYINAFYDGRVLLPFADNSTVFPSVVGQEAPNADLLAQVIEKARARGITVYAWLFSLNFGPSYARRPDRKTVFARNGYGESNLQDPAAIPEEAGVSHVFVDPYNARAQEDLRNVVTAIAQRQPDGIVFDYIRYPHRTQRITNNVRDLMIYGETSARQLLSRSVSQAGQTLIYNYLKDGKIGKNLGKGEILWKLPNGQPITENGQGLNNILWQLTLEHARAGIVSFLETVSTPARVQSIPIGSVFFPKGNLHFSDGVDPRLQPWDRLTRLQEWHPMLYSLCGNAGCIIDELARVIKSASPGVKICPTVAGFWNRTRGQRISVEAQFTAIQKAYPQLDCVSHFAYSWLDLNSDLQRRSCQLPKIGIKID